MYNSLYESKHRFKYLDPKYREGTVEHERYLRELNPYSRQTRIHIGHHNLGGPHTHGKLAPSHVAEKLGGLLDPTKLVDTIFDTDFHDKMVNAWHKAERDIKQIVKDPKDLALFIATGGATAFTKWSAEILAETFKPVFSLLGFKDQDIVTTHLDVQALWREADAFSTDEDWVLKEALGNKEYAEELKRIAIWGQNGNPSSLLRVATENSITTPVRTFFLPSYDLITELKDLHTAYPQLNHNFSVLVGIRGFLNKEIASYLELSKDDKFDLGASTYDGAEIDSIDIVEASTGHTGTVTLHVGANTIVKHFTIPTTVYSAFWIKLDQDITIPPHATPLPAGRELMVAIDHGVAKLSAATSTKPESQNCPILFTKQHSIYVSKADMEAKNFKSMAETMQLPLDDLLEGDKGNPSDSDVTTIMYGAFVGLWEEEGKIQESVGKYCYEYFEELIPLYGSSPVTVKTTSIDVIHTNKDAHTTTTGSMKDPHTHTTPAENHTKVVLHATIAGGEPFELTLVAGMPPYDEIVAPFLTGNPAGWDHPYDATVKGVTTYHYTKPVTINGRWLDDLITAIATQVKTSHIHHNTDDHRGGHQADHDNHRSASKSTRSMSTTFTYTYTFKPDVKGALENANLKAFLTQNAEYLMTKVKSFQVSQGDFTQTHHFTGLMAAQLNEKGARGAYTIKYDTDNILELTKQVTSNIKSRISVIGYSQAHLLKIEGHYGLAVAAYNRKQLLLPIDMKIFNQLDLFAQEELAARSRYKIAYAGTYEHLKYYQTAKFMKFAKVVIEVVSIVLSVMSGGTLAAPMEILKQLLFMYAIGKLTSYALKEIAEHVGDKNLRIALSVLVAVGGAALGVGISGGMNALNSIDGAMSMLNAGISGYGQMVQYEGIMENDRFMEELGINQEQNESLKKQARADGLDFGKTDKEHAADAESADILAAIRTRVVDVEDFDEFYDRISLDLVDVMDAWEEISV